MSETRHTPGPYFAGEDTGTDCPAHSGSGLAIIDTGRESDWPIARHVEWNNVALLTAAPELLENLKDMVRIFEGFIITNGTDKEFAQSATAHARVAIAKAEGRE